MAVFLCDSSVADVIVHKASHPCLIIVLQVPVHLVYRCGNCDHVVSSPSPHRHCSQTSTGRSGKRWGQFGLGRSMGLIPNGLLYRFSACSARLWSTLLKSEMQSPGSASPVLKVSFRVMRLRVLRATRLNSRLCRSSGRPDLLEERWRQA